jgi:hypothetical protein
MATSKISTEKLLSLKNNPQLWRLITLLRHHLLIPNGRNSASGQENGQLLQFKSSL